jgi:hypothetical protein
VVLSKNWYIVGKLCSCPHNHTMSASVYASASENWSLLRVEIASFSVGWDIQFCDADKQIRVNYYYKTLKWSQPVASKHFYRCSKLDVFTPRSSTFISFCISQLQMASPGTQAELCLPELLFTPQNPGWLIHLLNIPETCPVSSVTVVPATNAGHPSYC